MADLLLPWGEDQVSVALPAPWTVQQVAQPSLREAPDDWPDRIAMALSQPSSGLPLGRLLAARPQGRIAILVEDLTRHSPLPDILAIVLRELRHGGVTDDRMEIVFATGMHPPLTPEQAAAKVGPEAASIPWRCNPWKDRRQYVSIGTIGEVEIQIDRGVMEADLRILITGVSPHLQAGFGGGYKIILPGCASLETIRHLHRKGLGRTMRQLVGTDAAANPMRMMIDAAGSLLNARGATFSLQYMLDMKDLPCAIASGEVLPSQQMMAKQCAVCCGVPVGAPADVVITNAYPRDFDLWQTFKGIANTQMAARPGGVILCLSQCPGGLNGVRPPKWWPLSPTGTRRMVGLLGPEALGSLLTRLVPQLAGDAAFFVRIALQAVHRNPILLVSPTLHAQQVQFPALHIFGEVNEAIVAAQDILGQGPQRVAVFPAGGVTYPVASPLSAPR